MVTGEFNAGGTLRWPSIPSGEKIEIFVVALCSNLEISTGLMATNGLNTDLTFSTSCGNQVTYIHFQHLTGTGSWGDFKIVKRSANYKVLELQ